MTAKESKPLLECDANLFRAAYVCVSLEEVRYYLNGVYAQPHPRAGALLVATDGHRMVVIHDDTATCAKPAIIQLDSLGLAACAPTKKVPQPRLVVDGEGVVTVSDIWRSPKSCLIDGTYPDWAGIIPTEGLGNSIASFNGRYVGDFGRIAAMLQGEKTAPIRMVGGNTPSDPAVVLFPKHKFAFGILMPMRTDDAVKFPDWMLSVMGKAEPKAKAAA